MVIGDIKVGEGLAYVDMVNLGTVLTDHRRVDGLELLGDVRNERM